MARTHPSIAKKSLAAKLGTRLGVLAIVVTAGASTVGPVVGASGAARVATLGGTGRFGPFGDGGSAAEATFSSPAGLALDSANDVIVADTGNCSIREIAAAAGVHFGQSMRAHDVYLVAGSTCGASGDGARASHAQLAFPGDVAVDRAGDIIVADTGNHRIRMVAAAAGSRFGSSLTEGDIYTLAGDGNAGFAGDGGPAASARLNGPQGLAVDAAGDVFIADTDNCRVREIPAADGRHFGIRMHAHDIYTVAGNGTCADAGDGRAAVDAALRTPGDVAVDAEGNLLIADTGNRVLREVAAVPGTNFGVAMKPGRIYLIAGSGTYNPYFGDGLPAVGDAASLSFPSRLTVDAAGDLFVTDTYARAIREIPAGSSTAFGTALSADAIYTVAGVGPADSATAAGTATDHLVYPSGVAVDRAGTVYASDLATNRVVALSGPPG